MTLVCLRWITPLLITLCISPAAFTQSQPVFTSADASLLQEHGAGEGPAWHDKLGLLTSGDGHIMRRSKDGTVSVFLKGAGTNGLRFDSQDRLVMCVPAKRQVARMNRKGEITPLATEFQGKKFNQPNDLTFDSKGRIYFTDPKYGPREDMEILDEDGRPVEGVYRIDLDGTVARIITHEVDRPNGVAISADDRFLYVADNNNNAEGGARKLWRFELKGDGTINPKSQVLLHDWKSTRGPDGIKIDSKGRLFVAAGLNRQNPPFETQDEPTAGIYVFTPKGKLLEFLAIPRDECTNCAFGEEDRKTLFITAGGTLWSVRTNVPGEAVAVEATEPAE